jgi:hypothetical protein
MFHLFLFLNMRLLTEYCKQISLTEYLSTKTSIPITRHTITATDSTIREIVGTEMKRLGKKLT